MPGKKSNDNVYDVGGGNNNNNNNNNNNKCKRFYNVVYQS